MTLLPLDQIHLDGRSHASALRWIGLLYRRPKKVREAEETLSHRQRLASVSRLYLHAVPYLILAAALGRWFLFGVLGLKANPESALLPGLREGLLFHESLIIFDLTLGLGMSLSGGLTFGLTLGLASALSVALALGLVGGLTFGLAVVLAGGLIIGLTAGLTFGALGFSDNGLAYGLAGSLALGLVAGLVFGLRGGFAFGLAAGLVSGLAFAVGFLRLYYLPFHWIWLWSRSRVGIYRFHPVAWDDVCFLPFPGLDRLLVSYAQHDPAAGAREIDRLIDEYPSQREEALRARAILVARQAAATIDLSRLDEVLAGLPAGKKGFLRESPEIRRLAHEITALQARLDTLNRPFLRDPFAALLVKEIEGFIQQIAGFKPPLSTEIRKAARQWLDIARRQLDAVRTATAREPTHQVFRAGDPVDREREAFILRAAILGEVERQVMLDTGCPGLLVYGRRRMGKSTLLRNLEGLLPPRVQVVSLSMQKADAFSSLPDLVGLIARQVSAVVSDIPKPPANLKGLERFLETAQKRLKGHNRRLLLAIDEFENLDQKIGEGVLSKDLLAVIRESIQTHRHIIWTFAGSHSIDELVHAPWTSYLVSARTIEVTPFEPAETRLLLTEPLKHSTLWRAIEGQRPRFEPGFWGEGGIERIHTEAGGWPHLVQLVAQTVVDLVNDSGGALVDNMLLERALSKAVVHGNNVFLELLKRESRLPGEWNYLRAFRTIEEQPVPIDEALDRSLRRRRLVVEEGGRYRLRVPLMARWLRERI